MRHKMKTWMKIGGTLLGAAVILGGAGFWFVSRDQNDPLITPERQARMEASPHYKDGKFLPTTPHAPVKPKPSGMLDIFFPEPGNQIPDAPISASMPDLSKIPPHEDVIVWLGHSSFYVQLSGKKILIDPMAAKYASPVPFIIKAFDGTDVFHAKDVPDGIDALILSHDHWDHLDYELTKEIEPKVKAVVTGLGNGGYYEKWGYPLSKIHEEDWGTRVDLDKDLSIWVLPTRHFSGRMLQRDITLFASFAIKAGNKTLYYSGDGGYDGRFVEIGKQFGSFDIAIMEDGQYNAIEWPTVHMLPEQSVKASEEIHAKTVIPCHNGKYNLARHNWKEPRERFAKAAEGKDFKLIMPQIGEIVKV